VLTTSSHVGGKRGKRGQSLATLPSDDQNKMEMKKNYAPLYTRRRQKVSWYYLLRRRKKGGKAKRKKMIAKT